MNTWIVLSALVGSVAPSAAPATPQWQFDYRIAKESAAVKQKPLAVFIGSGTKGWEHLSKEGTLDEQSNRILSVHYICLYLDTTTDTGSKLASAFGVNEKGLVISDRTTELQAFHHNGQLTKDQLSKTLEKFSESNGPVARTETISGEARTNQTTNYQPTTVQSAYVPQTYASQQYFQPAPTYTQPYYQPSSFRIGGG